MTHNVEVNIDKSSNDTIFNKMGTKKGNCEGNKPDWCEIPLVIDAIFPTTPSKWCDLFLFRPYEKRDLPCIPPVDETQLEIE